MLKNDLLRELNLKPFSLTKHRNSLINFLTQHTQLEVLCLEVSEANRQDWLELSQILAIHPKLKSFNLGHSILDTNAYSALRDLLDENYRIKISLTEPTEENLLKVYEPLKQRLAKSNLERFKEDHLSQTKLLQVAISDLESQDQALKQFNFLLTNKGHLAITDNQKEDWVKNVDVLPTIYQYHKDYLKNESSLIQLHVDEFIVNESKTVGYVLLEKTLETKNLMAMQTLLDAKVDLFELPDNEENPFLVKLLQSKGDLKSVVVEHIRRDQRLAELAAECLTAYPDLSHNFGDLKTHLDQYSSHLVKRETPYALLAISNEILGVCRGLFGLQNPADTRGKECAQIYLDLDKSLQIIKADPEGVTYHNLSKIQRIMKEIKENSTKALRGLFNKSLLHEKVVILVDQFYDKLETSKNELDAKKDETIKQKDDEIKQIKENHKAEKSFLNDKLTKMETENAEIKAKNAEIKTENAEIKAQNLEIKQTLDNIIKQLNFKEPISLGTSSSSMSQDQTKTETRGFFKS